ncbi:acyl-CoA N-acyltransferase [Phascolomyces articulosus]|uniref:Acyl-CoA N-acyltransferase n=1 Tax=Phascolomyces articulosus TaxID=60185 RepID=A0AAD5JM85_9FUNG|nr:acyl-CoA N-acyltransferase [Phascolomyces articulosus]
MTNTPSYQNPKVILATTPEEKKKCADVRVKVFVEELGYPPELESLDTMDAIATLWLATCEKVDIKNNTITTIPVGTIRMLPYDEDDTVGVLSRLAVVSETRGMRLGQKLVEAFEDGVKDAGKKAIMVQGVAEKRSFYEALGYTVEMDETYIKDGSPHYKFWKRNL